MNDTNQTNQQTCNDEKHKEHLCFLQYEGYHYGHKAEYRALVQDAHFICENCGRTAKKATNLCAPITL